MQRAGIVEVKDMSEKIVTAHIKKNVYLVQLIVTGRLVPPEAVARGQVVSAKSGFALQAQVPILIKENIS